MATVPASPPFNLSTALAVFSLGVGSSLSQLRRSPGGVVPNTGPNAGVPTGAPLSMSQLRGATSGTALAMSASPVTGSTSVGISNDLIGNGSIFASGGTPPYTYNTVFQSGTSFTLSSATTASPQFRRLGNPPASNVTGTYRATVTDAVSASAFQDFVVTDNRS
jgi:hypothetical protein